MTLPLYATIMRDLGAMGFFDVYYAFNNTYMVYGAFRSVCSIWYTANDATWTISRDHVERRIMHVDLVLGGLRAIGDLYDEAIPRQMTCKSPSVPYNQVLLGYKPKRSKRSKRRPKGASNGLAI